MHSFAADVYALGMVCAWTVLGLITHVLTSILSVDNIGTLSLYVCELDVG